MNWKARAQRQGGVYKGPPPPERKAKKKAPERAALECLVCFVRYTVEDVLAGRYRLGTMVCADCYARMQASPTSCFGKPTTVMPDGQRAPGYEPEAPECSRLCPDRRECRNVVAADGV